MLQIQAFKFTVVFKKEKHMYLADIACQELPYRSLGPLVPEIKYFSVT